MAAFLSKFKGKRCRSGGYGTDREVADWLRVLDADPPARPLDAFIALVTQQAVHPTDRPLGYPGPRQEHKPALRFGQLETPQGFIFYDESGELAGRSE